MPPGGQVKPTKETPAGTLLRRIHARDPLRVLPGEGDSPTSPDELQHFQNYAEYSKTLRAWLVAYGIGGPVLLFTNDALAQAISNAPEKRLIVALFLIGVTSQVLLAFINKWCAWHLYAGEHDRGYRDRRTYKIWAWVADHSIIDFVIDATSLSAFAYSTWLTLRIFA
jgi:hypothetical protein